MAFHSAQIGELRRLLTFEIYRALGPSASRWFRWLLTPLFWLPSHRFASLAADFDQRISQVGLREAARWVLPRFVQGLHLHGLENIPAEGPLLLAANHPGTCDGLAIVSSLPREDVKIVVSGMPFIRGLPAASHHLIYVPREPANRMLVIRNMIRHLKEDGALLIFPGGTIEPDPAVLPGACESLSTWSRSLDIILERVPQTRVLVTIVSGVLAPECLRHPFARLRRNLPDQQRLAEIVQVIQQIVSGKKFPLIPQISFSPPFTALDAVRSGALESFHQVILARARQLLIEHR